MALEEYIFQKLNSHLPFLPSADQEALFRKLSAFLCSRDELFVLNGYAGTGKTTAMAALTGALGELKINTVLMAPTGRSAKVLSGYTGVPAHTIHKVIYWQRAPAAGDETGFGSFVLQPNKHKNTVFVVDEASLLSNAQGGGRLLFGSGRLLDDLMTYVFNGAGNRILLLGDSAQLPPVGLDLSPALDAGELSRYGNTVYFEMKEVLRQSLDSGILYNATLLRDAIVSGSENLPVWKTDGFNDIRLIGSGDLMEHLNDAISRYGLEDVVVLCRSNKRANRYNKGIRGRLLYREEDITKGDRVMVVKNCYQFLEGIEEMDFIANGDVAEIMRIHKFSERYGFRFAEAVLRFPDYNSVEINVKVLLNTLDSESPALPADEQQRFFTQVMEDYAHIKGKRKRYKEVREDPYLNALQIKYATALTCHKAQGGQWKAVFVDKAFFGDICTKEELRWYYTAFTRAQEQLYLVNL